MDRNSSNVFDFLSWSPLSVVDSLSENVSLLSTIQAWAESSWQHIDQWRESLKLDTCIASAFFVNCTKIIAVSTVWQHLAKLADIADDGIICSYSAKSTSGLKCEHYAWDVYIIGEAGMNNWRYRHPQDNVLITGIADVRQHVFFGGPFERLIAVCHYWIRHWIGQCRWRKSTELNRSDPFFVDHLNSRLQSLLVKSVYFFKRISRYMECVESESGAFSTTIEIM